MAEALEWFQCKKCGRRQRWTADIAGKTITCSCGKEIVCPRGVTAGDSMAGRTSAGTFTDTMIEDVDSPSARSPLDPFDSVASEIELTEEVERPLSMEEMRSTKQFYVWTGMMLFGLAMLIHAVITQFWWYIALAVIFAPLSFFKFHKARRRWQKGRPFWQTLARSLGG